MLGLSDDICMFEEGSLEFFLDDSEMDKISIDLGPEGFYLKVVKTSDDEVRCTIKEDISFKCTLIKNNHGDLSLSAFSVNKVKFSVVGSKYFFDQLREWAAY
jgi:hypothetical protein